VGSISGLFQLQIAKKINKVPSVRVILICTVKRHYTGFIAGLLWRCWLHINIGWVPGLNPLLGLTSALININDPASTSNPTLQNYPSWSKQGGSLEISLCLVGKWGDVTCQSITSFSAHTSQARGLKFCRNNYHIGGSKFTNQIFYILSRSWEI